MNDGDFENPENFTVILTTTDPAVELNPDTAVVQITDDGESIIIQALQRCIFDSVIYLERT